MINDGSTDNSFEICEKYRKKDSRVILISNNNHGVSYSRNCGIKKATGKYICFVDSDDWIDKYYIEKLLKAIKDGDNDASVCNYYSVYNHNYVKNSNVIFNVKKDFVDFITYNKCWTPWAKLFKKSKIAKPFDENVSSSEDLLFNFENNKYIKKYKYIDEPLYYYRRKDDEKLVINKVGKKEITELDAIIYMIDNSLGETKKFMICHFLCILYRIIYYDNKNPQKTFIQKQFYINKAKKYYKKLNKKYLSLKLRIKFFVMINLSQLYYIAYDLKVRAIKYK